MLVTAAAAVLTSCSQLGGGPGTAPGGAASTASGPVLASPAPTASPSEPIASDTPVPTEPAPSSDPSTGDDRTAVVPFITTADWDDAAKALDVSAIVPGIVEGGGTCTVTLTSGSTTRTAEGDGVAASSYTGCEAVAVTGLATGTWQVRVSYSSPTAAGASAVRTVQAG